MIAAILAAGRALGRSRQYIVLLLLGAAAAYVWVRWQEDRADRDRLAAWADGTCAAAGAPFAASGSDPEGKRCRAQVAAARAFRDDTDRQTAAALADAMRVREDKAAADSALARRAAEAARDAAQRMEIADAEAAKDDRVAREWFAALNDVGGLRAPRR